MVSAVWLQVFKINSLIDSGLGLKIVPNSCLLSRLFCGQMDSARYWIMRDRFIVNIWNLAGDIILLITCCTALFWWRVFGLRPSLSSRKRFFIRRFMHIPTIILGLHQEVVSDCPQVLDIKKPVAWTGWMMGSSYIAHFGALHSAGLQTG